jgi:hypothetical protein
MVVGGEKYIFICNQDNFAIYRKSADGMVIVKLNQGKTTTNLVESIRHELTL